jgi:hypothetical protein
MDITTNSVSSSKCGTDAKRNVHIHEERRERKSWEVTEGYCECEELVLLV